VGSYLGTKSVQYCAGFIRLLTQPNLHHQHNINLFRGCFLDLPVGKKENKMAVTAYSVFYDYDFGPLFA
jgi:hypothetical protein